MSNHPDLHVQRVTLDVVFDPEAGENLPAKWGWPEMVGCEVTVVSDEPVRTEPGDESGWLLHPGEKS